MSVARAPIRLYPFDYLVIGYSLLMLFLIALVGRPLEFYYDELIAYATLAALSTLIIHFSNEQSTPLSRFLRLCYPAILFTVFYRLTGSTMFLIFNSTLDWQLTAFEKAILGINPTLYIDQHLLNPWLTELFMAAYFCYYLMIPGAVLGLFFAKKYEQLKELTTAMCLAFFVSYPIFFLYPIEGPRWYYSRVYQHAVEGPFFRELVNVIIDNGAVRGGCVPSTHVAVALVITMFAFRHYRTWRWPLTVITAGLAIGTFWGRFHYVSDVVLGAAIAVVCTLLVWKFWPCWTRGVKVAQENESALT